MILLIDAYNVLKQIISSDQASAQEKTAFIATINRYARLKKVSIELVFDGGPYGLPDRVSVKNITVSHSGGQESADDVIKKLIQAYKGRDVLLVSTDRELGRFAKSRGVEVLDSADFYCLVRKALEAEESLEKREHKELMKTTETQNPELDALMAEFSVVIRKGVPEDVEGVKSALHRKTPSKKERQLEKKLRKL